MKTKARFDIRKLTAIFTAMVMALSAIPAFTVTASADSLILGDANGDSTVDAGDALFVLRCSVGLDDMSNVIIDNADVNGDNSTDSSDALLILRITVGLYDPYQNDPIKSTRSLLINVPQKNVEDLPNYELIKEVVDLTNSERAKKGLDPLEIDYTLCECCAVRIDEIQELFDHIRPNGEAWSTVLSDFNFYIRSAGENLARGTGLDTPDKSLKEWMASTDHRNNILNAEFTKIGVGIAYVDNCYYWVQHFASVHTPLEDEQAEKLELINDINNARKKNNLPELTIDKDLEKAGEERASEVPNEYNKMKSMTKEEKEEYQKSLKYRGAEILDQHYDEWLHSKYPTFYGYQSASEIFDSISNEEKPFYLNDLEKKDGQEEYKYSKIGIGYTFVQDDDNGHYWCIMLSD